MAPNREEERMRPSNTGTTMRGAEVAGVLLIVLLSAVASGATSRENCLEPLAGPSPGKALVNLHRYQRHGLSISVFAGERFLTALPGRSATQIEVDPGEHIFVGALGMRAGKTGVFVQAEAGKTYDILVKAVVGFPDPWRAQMIPITVGSEHWERVPDLSKKECFQGEMFPGMPGVSIEIQPPIEEVLRRLRSGEWTDRLVIMKPEDGH
jgi:hypothetical protein